MTALKLVQLFTMRIRILLRLAFYYLYLLMMFTLLCIQLLNLRLVRVLQRPNLQFEGLNRMYMVVALQLLINLRLI